MICWEKKLIWAWSNKQCVIWIINHQISSCSPLRKLCKSKRPHPLTQLDHLMANSQRYNPGEHHRTNNPINLSVPDSTGTYLEGPHHVLLENILGFHTMYGWLIMWFPQSLVFLSQPNILLMKAEVLQMIRLHEWGKANYLFPVSNSRINRMLMHHENVCSLWPDVSHCVSREKITTLSW